MRKGLGLIFIFLFLYKVLALAQYKDSLRTQSDKFDSNRFYINSGVFISGISSKVRFGSKELGLGIDINLEDALDLNTTNLVFRGSAGYLLGKKRRHSIKAAYFAFLRSSDKTLETELEFNDTVYPVGTEISSIFNFSIIKFAYDYSYYKDDRVDLGIGGGFYLMPILFKVDVQDKPETEIANFTAPLPYIALRTDFKIHNKLYLKQGLDLLYVRFDSYTGVILDINVRLEHHLWKHFGLGAGLDFFKILVRSENQRQYFNFVGNVEMSYTGLLVFAKYYF